MAKGYRFPYLLLTPAVLFVLLVTFFPVVQAISTSLYKTVYLNQAGWIGLVNYVNFLKATAGRQAVLNSLVYVIGSLALAIPLGTILALVLDEPLLGRKAFRTLLVVPWVISQLVTGLTFSWLFNPQFGPVNYFVRLWVGQAWDFLGSGASAMFTLILSNVWRIFPYAMLLVTAALQTVPNEVMEAARVDGASAWTRFWQIRLPFIRSTLLVTTIMLSLHSFNTITLPLVLTGGGPSGATNTMALETYRQAFEFQNIGYGSAIAVYIFLFNMAFSLLYFRVIRSEPQL